MLKHDDIFKYEEGTDFKTSLCNLYEAMYKTDLHSEIDKIKYISPEGEYTFFIKNIHTKKNNQLNRC